MNTSYPRVDDAMLIPFRAIEALIKKNPRLLDSQECPYSPAVREFLATRLGRGEAVVKTRYDDDDLEQEIADLYSEIKRAGLTLGTVDPKDKSAMLKTSADLLTKMVTLRERVMNIRFMGGFQKTVIEILETLLTPAQRSEFIQRMGTYLNADLPVDRTEVLGQGDLGDPAQAEGEGSGA